MIFSTTVEGVFKSIISQKKSDIFFVIISSILLSKNKSFISKVILDAVHFAIFFT
jgi:hypothetical protein